MTDPDDETLLRVISAHGSPRPHRYIDGSTCNCWSEAKRVLKDLRQAGYVISKEFTRA